MFCKQDVKIYIKILSSSEPPNFNNIDSSIIKAFKSNLNNLLKHIITFLNKTSIIMRF